MVIRRWRAPVAALMVAAVLAGCGSTAQRVGGASASGRSSSDGLRLDASDLPGGGGDPATLDDPVFNADGTASAAPRDGQENAAAGGGGGGTAGGAAAPAGPATGRGFTEKEIYIGYLTWKDVSAAGSAIGYAVDYGDQEQIARAIADDLNANGGIAGRKVVPVFYDYNTGDVLANQQQGDQAACSRLTEDRPVFAVVAVTGILSEVLPDCLAKRKTPLIANTNIPYLKKFFDQWSPYFYSTASPMTERFVPAWLRQAAAAGYFTGWNTTAGTPGNAPVKVGILSSDSEAGSVFTELVTAELKRQGREIGATYALSGPFDQNGMNSAVLKFRSEGVTHVVPDGLNLILFPQSAESQRYRPRYAISTAQAPILVQSAAPREQLSGSLGVGYFPSYDVDTANDPGDPSPAAARCREVQKKAGGNPAQRESWNLMGKACDGFAFVAAAVRLGGLTPDGMRRGAAQLDGMPPTGTFALAFGPNRADGPAAVRDLGYAAGCSCYRFLNKTNHAL